MPLSEQLSHIEYLQVTGSDPVEIFCGSDQEWFPTERQRLTGCGPSAAANILFYLNRINDRSCCGRDRADLLDFMEDAWQSASNRWYSGLESFVPVSASSAYTPTYSHSGLPCIRLL